MIYNEYRIIDGKTVRTVVEADYSENPPDWFKRQRMMGLVAQFQRDKDGTVYVQFADKTND